MRVLVALFAIFTTVYAFTGDERFVRKYAMMKVYESCFGPDVVKEVRMEMQMAASKCSVLTGQPPLSPVNSVPNQNKQSSKIPHDKNSMKNGGHIKTTNHIHRLSNKQDSLTLAASNPPLVISNDEMSAPTKAQAPTIDLEKLQEAILAGFSKPAAAQGQFPVSSNPANAPSLYQPYQQYSSGRPTPYYAPPAQYYPPPSHYQPPQYVPNPAYYQQPMYQPPYPNYYGRSSRDLDVRGQLETLATRMSGRIQNITCVMQELGYLDANMDPDYGRMIERIGRLPVADELKRDMTEGVEFCRRFSQCLPNDKKDKLVRDMVQPMFFFRCYKHKKLEACIMKDVRERYNGSDDLAEENLTSDARSAKVFPEDMGTAVYEFLYGDGNVDLDSFF